MRVHGFQFLKAKLFMGKVSRKDAGWVTPHMSISQPAAGLGPVAFATRNPNADYIGG